MIGQSFWTGLGDETNIKKIVSLENSTQKKEKERISSTAAWSEEAVAIEPRGGVNIRL